MREIDAGGEPADRIGIGAVRSRSHDVSILSKAGVGPFLGCEPRSNISMTIMRLPQQDRQACEGSAGPWRRLPSQSRRPASHPEQFARPGDIAGAVAVGEQPVVPYAVKPLRQDVDQEPADELARGEPCTIAPCRAFMRGALVAESDGALMPYVDSVFRRMWEEPRKMDDPQVIRAALDAAGFDGARILAGTQEQVIKDKLLKNTQASVARGTFGAPTFFVGEEIFFGKDKLRDVEEEIEAAMARD